MPTRSRLILFIALVVTAASVPAPVLAQNDQPTESALPATPDQPVALPQLTNENWSLALADANPYRGAPVTLYAKVANLGSSDGTNSEFQVFTNLVSYADGGLGVSYVIAPPGTQVKTDDYVRVEGTLYAMFEGTNFVGATVRAPQIMATRVEMATRDEAHGPIVKTAAPNAQQAALGVSIAVERIELAQRETRVFVHVRNNGTGNATIDFDGISLAQGSLRHRAKNPSGSGYSSTPNQLRPRQDAKGVLLFDPIQPTGSARLELSSIRSGSTAASNPVVMEIGLD